jgi:DNA-binding MarR family transcriptional regulator
MSTNQQILTDQDRDLAHAIRDFVTRMQRRLRKQVSNPHQLSVAEVRVLSTLLELRNPQPSTMCEQLRISSQFMSQVLNRLQDLGYIERMPDPSDRRKTQVILTEEGKIRISDSRVERESWLYEKISDNFSGEDRETMRKAMSMLSTLPDF